MSGAPAKRSGPPATFVRFDETTVRPVPDGDAEKARVILAELADGDGESLRTALEALGLSTRRGDVIVRFGQHASQVRIYRDVYGDLRCQWCRLSNVDYYTADGAVMVSHMREHRRACHAVPGWVDEAILAAGS